MTSLDQSQSTATREPEEASGRVREIVSAVRELLNSLTRRPERMSVQAGEVKVEVVWPQSDQVAPELLSDSPAATLLPDAPPDDAAAESETFSISSPSVGVFYRAPEPGAKPFVEEGDMVESGQQVAIVEAMKLMLPVEAEREGKVGTIFVDDGEPVEYGDQLLGLLPHGD